MVAVSTKNGILLFLLAILLFFSMRHLAIIGPLFLDKSLSYCIYPFLKIQQTIVNPIKNYIEQRKYRASLQDQLADAQAQKELLLAKVVALQSSLQFMNDTRELVEFQQRFEQHGTLAQVLMRSCSAQGHFFLIDAGSNKGVHPDMVAVYKNCLVGRVSEVYPHYSKVVLITDRTCKVAAYCAQTQACGIHEGMNNSDVTALSFVSHLQTLQDQDMIISSGDGLIFPRGFGLGYIHYFESDGVHYTVRVKPLIDVSTLSYCYLIAK